MRKKTRCRIYRGNQSYPITVRWRRCLLSHDFFLFILKTLSVTSPAGVAVGQLYFRKMFDLYTFNVILHNICFVLFLYSGSVNKLDPPKFGIESHQTIFGNWAQCVWSVVMKRVIYCAITFSNLQRSCYSLTYAEKRNHTKRLQRMSRLWPFMNDSSL